MSSENNYTEAHLLSPDYMNRPLPSPESTINMRQEPEAPLPVPNEEILNVLPPGFVPVPAPGGEGRYRRPSGAPRPSTPYAEAPLSGAVYPDPPTSTLTSTAIDDLYGSPRYVRPRKDSLGESVGGLSPLHIGKPLTVFSSPNPVDYQGLST